MKMLVKEEISQMGAMLRSTDIGFFLVDANYKILRYNNAALHLYETLTGIKIIPGIDFTAGLIEHRKAIVRKYIDNALHDGIYGEYEIQYYVPGELWLKLVYRPAFNNDDNCTGVCVTMENITTRKKLEEELRFSRAKFASAFNYSGIGMALVTQEGNFIDVNPALTKLLGYSKEELLHKTFQDLTYPEDLDKGLQYRQQMLKKEIDFYEMEKRYFKKNGSIITVMLSVSLVLHKDGSPNFFIAQIVDISYTKSLVKELESKNDALEYTAHDLQTKIKQLEEFTHLAGHNLRGIATNIKSITDLLAIAEQNELPAWIERLKTTSDALNTALAELLQFSQLKLTDKVKYEDCDIRSLCNDVLQQVVPANMDQPYKIEYSLGFNTVQYVKVYLHSILYNLLSNAFKYRMQQKALEIKITSTQAGGKNKLIISDNGIGFDAEANKDKVFTLNATFHKGYNSKGIGLFITKSQIEKLGGTISVESTPGNGTAFTITF